MENSFKNFRFAYFSDKYEETCRFLNTDLGFPLEHSWDRNDNDKGSVFKAGHGLIEVLKLPEKGTEYIKGVDYRPPQGAFMVIQTMDVDSLYDKLKAKGHTFKEEIVDQSWGHRSFSILDPNGVVIMFIQDPFDTEK